MKFLLIIALLLSMFVPQTASADLEEISFAVYVYDCGTNPIFDADVKFDFFYYIEDTTYVNGNYYYYVGPAFDIVAPVVNGVTSDFRLAEEMMAQNVFYCEVNLPYIGK